MIPVFSGADVRAAVSPERALEAVREAFIAYARGEWTMPPKVYVPAYPAGDFRAMPALGAGHALLKWVTSFPANPLHGLPTVTGLVLMSDASNGMPEAVLDAGAVTALRTGAAAVLAAETLGRPDASNAAVIGAGVNGEAAAQTFAARGCDVLLWDVDQSRAAAVAERLGATAASRRDEALDADLLVTVTPGREILLGEGSLRPGQHASLMGADGPGKAEIAVEELARVHVFCDDWEQASHNGDLVHAIKAGVLTRDDVAQLGDVLIGTADGRETDQDITVFDSTGLAIQDLAIAIAALERAAGLDLPMIELQRPLIGRIDDRLTELGLVLPEAMDPPGNFKLVNVHAGVAYVAGHPAISGTQILTQGVVGRDLTLEEGYNAARLTALSILASLKKELGELERVKRWLRAVGYVQTAPHFHDNAKVLNGFSDLIVELWGDDGRHARSAPGQGPSPLNVPVIVDAIVAVAD